MRIKISRSNMVSSIACFSVMKDRFQDYLGVYDGKVKPYQEMQDMFESLFHDSFIHTMDGRPIDKDQMRELAKLFLSVGTKIDLIFFKPLDKSTFEVKLRIINRIADVQSHSKVTIRGGQIVRFEAYEDAKAAYEKANLFVGLSQVKQNFEYFLERQEDTGVSFDSIEDAYDRLFHGSLVASLFREQFDSRGMRTTSSELDDYFQSTSSFILKQCEVIDETRMEIEVEKNSVHRDGKSTREVWHDVLTVKDASIILIEPCIDFNEEVAYKVECGKRRRVIPSSHCGRDLLARRPGSYQRRSFEVESE
mmetsp:Transcript_30531/g.52099  ORF Transcript_30531/g.52099 Transcript_30531/m.52099 type:complete len:307 (+) Transcript_30531:56-976(+)